MEWTPEKVHELEQMLLGGSNQQACADFFGVSRERISQVRKKRLPHLEAGHWGRDLVKSAKILATRESMQQRFNRPTFKPASALEAAQSASFIRKRTNAKAKTDWEFTVKREDIEWPTHCPILGLELDWFAEVRQENSPSYDRIKPDIGYVPGNVAIVSWRANRIKNDGTAEEHRKIAEWLDKQAVVCS